MNPETHRLTTCPMCHQPVEAVRGWMRWRDAQGVQFERELMPKGPRLCDPCSEIIEQNEEANEATRSWKFMLKRRMPSDYQQAIVASIPPIYRNALSWDRVRCRGGMGLIGEGGSGKSCALACVIMARKEAFLWWSGVEARTAAIDAQMADRRSSDLREKWDYAMRTPLLVLDDISQGKMTEGWSAALFGLLETRLSRSRPVLWTSQIGMAQFRAKIEQQNGGDFAQADAITRRLSQHSLLLGLDPRNP